MGRREAQSSTEKEAGRFQFADPHSVFLFCNRHLERRYIPDFEAELQEEIGKPAAVAESYSGWARRLRIVRAEIDHPYSVGANEI